MYNKFINNLQIRNFSKNKIDKITFKLTDKGIIV